MAKYRRRDTVGVTKENGEKRTRRSPREKAIKVKSPNGICPTGKDHWTRRSPREEAIKVKSPNGICPAGKHHYKLCSSLIFEIDKKYVPIKALGAGSYGVVCSATNAETGERVAIKRIMNALENPEDGRRTLRELRLLRHLKHENIMCIKDFMKPVGQHSFKDVYIVSDLMDCDLQKLIRSPQVLMDKHVQYFMYQLLCGLKYMHSANVIHRDLKPGNVLVNEDSCLKICNFGLARTRSDEGLFMTQYVQTRWYRAPELLLSAYEYSSAIDMWSLGCIFAELLGREPIFPGKDYLHQVKLIINTIGSPDESDLHFVDYQSARTYIGKLPLAPRLSLARLYTSANPLATDLLDKMLVFDPKKRISAKEALQHPYMRELHDESTEPLAPAWLEFDFENDYLTEDELRKLIWDEMLFYHPDV